MKKIIINHHPINYMMLAFFGIFLIAPLSMLIMMVCYEKGIDVGATVLIMLIPVVIYAVIFSMLNAAKAVVEWDDKNINVTYLKRTKNIRSSDIKQISYTVYKEEHGRGISEQRIELTFLLPDDEEFCLSDKIDTDDIGSLISGEADFPLMSLYNHIAGKWPEKCIGYQKSEDR